MRSRSLASRLESGSSSSRSCGSITSARASASRCCWPPESLVASRSARSIELHRLQHAHDLVADLLLGQPAHLERKGDVLEHVHVRPDRVGLEHHAEVALVGRDEDPLARRVDEASGDLDLARGRLLQPGDRAQRRGLAAAGGAEQREQLALRHVERHVLRGLDHGAVLVGIFGEQRSHAQHVSTPAFLCFCNSEPSCRRAARSSPDEQRHDEHARRARKARHTGRSATAPRS